MFYIYKKEDKKMTSPAVTCRNQSKVKYTGRINEVLKQIKGKDKRISSREEAEAILEFSKHAEVLWTDDKDALPLAYMEAQNYLNGGKNLGEYILEAYHSIKEKGAKFLTKVSNKVSQ